MFEDFWWSVKAKEEINIYKLLIDNRLFGLPKFLFLSSSAVVQGLVTFSLCLRGEIIIGPSLGTVGLEWGLKEGHLVLGSFPGYKK